MCSVNFPKPVADVDDKEVEANEGKAENLQRVPAGDTINGISGEMARKAYQEQMGRRQRSTGGVLCVAFFIKECPNAFYRWSTRALPATVTYQGLYYNRKTKSQVTDEKCRLCGDSLENVQHILTGCSALAQTKYLQTHNNAFKILFFEVLRSLDLITKVEPSWFSQDTLKALYENEHATAF